MVDNQTEAPVSYIPTDVPGAPLDEGWALCLSGGGYRAMLFHAGALWRLNELGLLPRFARVSSVSGGSIAAATLGLSWQQLAFGPSGVAQAFGEKVVAPLRALARRTIDVPAIISGMLPFVSVNARIAAAYRRHLFGSATLQHLPDAPRFIFNSSNLQSGALWLFSKASASDWRVGKISKPIIPLARAVAASSAFPPFLAPARFTFRDADYLPGSGRDLQRAPYTTRVVLSDGGVYDNLGLETAYKRCRTVLVSDAGGRLQPTPRPHGDWIRQSLRAEDVVYNQVGALRKRQLIAAFKSGDRGGAYWGIWTDVANYKLPDALPCPVALTAELARTPTRLAALPSRRQEQLINWGYAVCDAALRRHVDPALPKPSGFPYPGGVG